MDTEEQRHEAEHEYTMWNLNNEIRQAAREAEPRPMMTNFYHAELLELFLTVQSENQDTLTRFQLRRYDQYKHSYRVVRIYNGIATNAAILASKLDDDGVLWALVAKVGSGEWVE